MGQVYRAHDTRLNRDVALKILPDAFANDADRLARFTREAQTLASLNHPHIAALYGLEESGGVRALVMELVEGEDLSQRIARGPIPIDEALSIAKQIAEALEAAHEQGIIHRDLKPANLKVTPDGIVKVLDFGLAKLNDPNVSNAPNGPNALSMSPTISSPAMVTGVGVLLGTAAYMAPEQAKGRPADKQSDIWAFGCVLFEMLTGKRAFEGQDVSDTLAAILRGEPDWKALRPATPAAIRRVLRRSLERDRHRRLSDIGDARLDIEEASTASSWDTSLAPEVRVSPVGWRRVVPWAVGLAGIIVAAVALWAPWRATLSPPAMRLNVDLGADVTIDTLGGSAAMLSADGSTLAFVGHKATGPSQIYIRRLDQLQATPLAGTESARDQFFSPDGRWLAFFSNGKLRKISVTGGAPVTLCDAPSDRGGWWADDGSIVFVGNSQSGISRVSSAGGKPETLTTLADGEATQRFPQLLPGGKGILYAGNASTGGWDNGNIYVQPLPTGSRRLVQHGGYYPRYLPSGHLLYIQQGALFAAPFDLDRLEITGPSVPVIEHVSSDAIGSTVLAGRAEFAVSANGTLVYLVGQGRDAKAAIEWVDHTGHTTPLRSDPADWGNLSFAPDGQRIAMDIAENSRSDVWVYEWARDTLTRLTFGGSAVAPVWTPDGQRIVFGSTSDDGTPSGLSWRRADGTGDVQRLTTSKFFQVPASWDPAGKTLAFQEQNPETTWDIVVLPIQGNETSGWKTGKPTIFLNTPAIEQMPMFSPDGRWLAYASNESGRFEVYVRPYPGPGGKWQISTDGGTFPKWSRNRPELFYSTTDGHIMVVAFSVDGSSFHPEKPRPWSERNFAISTAWTGGFDIHPDGDRFALATIPESQTPVKQDRVIFLFNFFDELRRIVATK